MPRVLVAIITLLFTAGSFVSCKARRAQFLSQLGATVVLFQIRPSARRGLKFTLDRHLRSKCRCSCVLQFTRLHAVSCGLHRPTSRVIHHSRLIFTFFLFLMIFHNDGLACVPVVAYIKYVSSVHKRRNIFRAYKHIREEGSKRQNSCLANQTL
jgi:hypothetical protein